MRITLLALAASALAASAAQANSISGQYNGLTWEARNMIVGAASTGGFDGGGDSRYFAAMPKYNGVVSLIMNRGAAGNFICSGTLLPDRRSILTAAHCVSSGAGTANPVITTAYFYGGDNPNTRLHTSTDPAVERRTVSQYFVNSGYTGQVIDQNDIAILRLSERAPEWANSYRLSGLDDLTSTVFNVAGYGGRSDTGGTVGNNSRTGFLRQGDNRYEWRLGDPAFGANTAGVPTWQTILGGTAQKSFTWMSDFDNGLAINDTGCRVSAATNFPRGLNGAKYCNTGVGRMEVSVAGGDSGGPQFVDGKITSVTSFGLTFGTGFGDVRAGLNSSFGEFNGFVPVSIHRDFIGAASFVPEPATWAMMIAGFGMVGGALRRRRAVAA